MSEKDTLEFANRAIKKLQKYEVALQQIAALKGMKLTDTTILDYDRERHAYESGSTTAYNHCAGIAEDALEEK